MNSSEKINKGASLMAEGIAEIFNDIATSLSNACKNLVNSLSSINFDKKLTKKRFCKLLQSHGIQRNEINKIVANNKEPYTYRRLCLTLNKYKKG